jgi:hypothetical protein
MEPRLASVITLGRDSLGESAKPISIASAITLGRDSLGESAKPISNGARSYIVLINGEAREPIAAQSWQEAKRLARARYRVSCDII